MDETGKADLYLHDPQEFAPSGPHQTLLDGRMRVTNWSGSLDYTIKQYSRGKHNITGKRVDVWFIDHASREWHGVQYGMWTQICHCKRKRGA